MGDINVIPRIDNILVAPAKQSINVFNIKKPDTVTARSAGNKLFLSSPQTVVLPGAITELDIWNFILPTTLKVGDHIRIRYTGAFTVNESAGIYFRVWLGSTQVTQQYCNPLIGPAGSKQAFMQEFDILFQAPSSAFVMQNFMLANTSPTTETPLSTMALDGTMNGSTYHSPIAYTNPLLNTSGLGCRVTWYYGGTTGTIRARGLTVEHLIAA